MSEALVIDGHFDHDFGDFSEYQQMLKDVGASQKFNALIINHKIPKLAEALPDHVGQLVVGGKTPMPAQQEDGFVHGYVLGIRPCMMRKYPDSHPEESLRGRVACAATLLDGKYVSSVANGSIAQFFNVMQSEKGLTIVPPDEDMPSTNECAKCAYGNGRCGGRVDGRGFADVSKIQLKRRGKPYVPNQQELANISTRPSSVDCQATFRAYILVWMPGDAFQVVRLDLRGSNYPTGQKLFEAWVRQSANAKQTGVNGPMYLRKFCTKRGKNAAYDYLTIEYAGESRDTTGKVVLMDGAQYDENRELIKSLHDRANVGTYYTSLESDDSHESTESSATSAPSASSASPAPGEYDDAF